MTTDGSVKLVSPSRHWPGTTPTSTSTITTSTTTTRTTGTHHAPSFPSLAVPSTTTTISDSTNPNPNPDVPLPPPQSQLVPTSPPDPGSSPLTPRSIATLSDQQQQQQTHGNSEVMSIAATSSKSRPGSAGGLAMATAPSSPLPPPSCNLLPMAAAAAVAPKRPKSSGSASVPSSSQQQQHRHRHYQQQHTRPSLRGGGSSSMACNKFMLYESRSWFYVAASNTSESLHRIIKINRTAQDELVVIEDEAVYPGREMTDMLKMLEDGNKTSGGLSRPKIFFGIIGTRLLNLAREKKKKENGQLKCFPGRFREVYRGLVHAAHHEAIAGRAHRWSLRVSLRRDGNAYHTVESQDRKAKRGTAPHGSL